MELINYIQTQLQAGYTRAAIEQALRVAGWQEIDIAAAFAQLQATPLSAPAPTMQPVPHATNRKKITSIILVIIGLIIGGIILAVTLFVVMRTGGFQTTDDSAQTTTPTLEKVADTFLMANPKAKEAKRKSDLQSLQGAIELYYSDHFGIYPAELTVVSPDYILAIPIDSVTNESFYYEPTSDLKGYKLCPPDYTTETECLTD